MLSVDTTRNIIGIIGNAICLVLFLSPFPTIMKIWKEGTVAQYSSVPYLATFINCGLWSLYGIPFIHPKALFVLTIDGAGLAIELVFLFVFFFCSDKKKRSTLALVVFAELIFVAALAALVIAFAHTWKLRSAIIGTVAAMASVAMYASPLASMKLVITTKSVEYMPFSLSLCSLLNSLCWTLYALVGIIDLCLLVPNGIGVLLGLAQLVLYAKYYKSNKDIEEKKQVHVQVDLSELAKGKPMNDA